MSRFRRVSLYVSGLVSVIHLVVLYLFWGRIPERIPLHIGLNGTIDNYGHKTNLLHLAVAGWGVAVLLFALHYKAPRYTGYDPAGNKKLVLGIASILIPLFLLLFSCGIIFQYAP
ncbi:DUF1648 domain-containing protein [Paenibacillus tepidiphilus]|uniref:DUF1648 domain-containing protein n=1 Tax=Paenibacillus tepidiphilus TaxID=2608683 RepID=UPI0013A577EE|nr:DUF1648 domain-containing protein [Paenibacillus tepidiphilus]